MTTKDKPGPVEAAVRADIADLGTLRDGQSTLAAQALSLAQDFDGQVDERISRELRIVMKDLRTLANARGVVPTNARTSDTIDELRKRRQDREAGTGGA